MTAAKAFKSAAVAAFTTVCPTAYVCYGPPGTWDPEDIIMLLDVRSSSEPGPMSIANRAREETLELDGLISVFRGGSGEDVQQVASEAAFDYLTAIEAYLKDAGVVPSSQNTLSGSVRWAAVTSHTLHEVSDDEGDISQGRLSGLEFTITARTRI